MRKKILAFTLVLFSAILLVACNKSTDQDVVDSALGRLTVQAEASENFTVSAKDGDVAITWVSQNTNILTVGATADDKTTITVARPAADTNVVLEATLTLGEVSEKKQFTVKVLGTGVPVTEVVVTFTATLPEGTPAGDIFLAGDLKHEDLQVWGDEHTINASRTGLTATFSVTYDAADLPVEVAYKWTRGNWATVEKDADGEEMDNRLVTITANTATLNINDVVASWADDTEADETPPVFAGLPGDGVLKLEFGPTSYDWRAGVTVTDNVDSNVTFTVDESEVDLTKLGTFNVTYSATDAAGNNTTVVVAVTVGDTTAPLIGGYKLWTLKVGATAPDWEEGIIAIDKHDGEIDVEVDASEIDLETAGDYVLLLKAQDNAENETILRVRVRVVGHAHSVLNSLEVPGKTQTNLTLPTNVDNLPVVWTSTDPSVLSNTGVVTLAVKDKTVKLTATVNEISREFWVTVRGSEVDLGATYSSAFSEIITLNPLMSTGSSDSDVFDYLTDTLYSGDYDWEDAIANGYADFPGDFSKIRSDRNPDGTVEMPSIKYKQTLNMAAAYPYAVNRRTDNAVSGSFGQVIDGEASKNTQDDTWIITLRDDLKFVDGTVINAHTFEFSFQQYLNPRLNNERANYLYNADYIPLVNGHAYFLQGKDNPAGGKYPEVSWEDVGFRIVDDLSFEIRMDRLKTQYDIISYLNMIDLVHQQSWNNGYNATLTENNYGSVQNPLVSYGRFTLENDYDDTNIFFFTRNEEHFAAWDTPFEHIRGPIITQQTDVINAFKAGTVDVAGVGGEFWNEFFEHPNLYVSPSNSFYRLAISIERPEDRSNPIMAYKDFRHALYLATDREEFANTVQPPSQGKLGYLSNIHQVSEWATEAYAASATFNQQLEALGLSPETGGFDSEEAKRLFDKARAEAIAAGEFAADEVIKMQFLYVDAGSNTRIANWVKAQYEQVFNAGETTPVFEVELDPVSTAELNQQRAAGDFDLVFTGMSGATFQATFGMGYIFSPTYSTFLVGKGHGIPTKQVTADISNLLFLLDDKDAYDETQVVDGELPENMRTEAEQAFYDKLDPTDGIFTGEFDELFDLYSETPSLDIDYDGQQEDLTNITAALERALLEQMIAVPLFSSTSAAVYANNVVRQAHAYHLFLGWGGMSYMYKTVTP